MADQLVKLAREHAMLARTRDLSADIEVQLSGLQGGRPVIEILRRLRDEAAEAMVGLVLVDAENIIKVRDLQRKVLQFDDYFRVVKDIVHDGIEADKTLSTEELDEFRDELLETEEGAETAAELGLIDKEQHDA
jgi:hypothetical protein